MMGRTHLTDATIGPGAVADLDWDIVGSGDFDGDGQVDLVWQNSTTGAISTWLLEAQSVWPGQAIWRVKSGVLFSPGRVADTAWKIRGVADMDRDGKPDLIWQHETSGLIATWLMDGLTLRDGTLFTSGQVQDTDWTIVGPK